MAGWAGFTEDELRKLKVSGKDNHAITKKSSQLKRPRTSRSQFTSQPGDPPESALHPSQRLSRPQSTQRVDNKLEKPGRLMKKQDEAVGRGGHETQRIVDKASKSPNANHQHSRSSATPGANGDEQTVRELDEVEVISSEINRIEVFQKQQKMIEEANKQKCEYLTKTISERQKKAKAENEKLTKIQRELNHLDCLLSTDVAIIRDRIEEASLQYQEAQRKYEKAEQEFIKTKMNLFDKGEAKEQLTEHLYTIINQNEARKAKKLAELMKQLEMEISLEEMELQIPVIPPLTNFNSVHTLNSPLRKTSDVPFQPSNVIGVPVSGGGNDRKGDSQQVTNKKQEDGQNVTSECQDGSRQVTNEKQGTIEHTSNEKTSNISDLANEKAGNIQHSGDGNAVNSLDVSNENEANKSESQKISDTNNKSTLLQMCAIQNYQTKSCDQDSVSGLTDSTSAVESQHAANGNLDNNNVTLPGPDNSCSSSSKNGVVHDTNQNCVDVKTPESGV